MFKILIPAILFLGNAFADFNISNIKLTETELVIEGKSLEDVTSLAIISNDSRVDFQVGDALPDKVTAHALENGIVSEGNVLKLVISDSTKEFTFPIALSEKNESYNIYKVQKKKEPVPAPTLNPQDNFVLENKSKINFLPGDDFTGYDYNYSIYANPTGDFAIKGLDKDLFKIDNEGNVEISGTLKVKGRPIGYSFLPLNDSSAPVNAVTKSANFTSANKVVLSAGPSKELSESGYTIPMNICPKGQILKSDGVNFVCSLEASQEEQLGPVYTNNKSNFGINQINRNLQISNVVIGSDNNINGVVNFTASGDMNIATGTFKVDTTTGRVGIGTGIIAPSAKLDVIGAANSGIRLKQAGQITNVDTSFSNGMVFVDSASNKAAAIGYGVNDVFSITGFDGGAYKTLFTLNSTGGVIDGNLKIGAYTLPAADGASGTVLKTNGSGTASWAQVAGGTVNGPGTTIVGNIASWNDTTGTLLADGNKAVANLVTNAGASATGAVPYFTDASGKIIAAGTKLEVDLVTGPASASASDNLASFNTTSGKIIKDSGISSNNVMTMSAVAIGTNVLSSVLGTKSAVESTTPIANLATMSSPSTKQDALILSATNTDKTQKATAYSVPFTLCPSGQSWKSDGTNMICSGSTAGDVTSSSLSADNAIARFDSTTGKVIQNSGVIIDDTNNVTGILTLSTTGLATLNSLAVTNNASAVTLSTSGAATLNSLGVTTNATVSGTLGVAGQITVNNGNVAGQFTLPIGRGSPNQALITDGAGGTSWQPNPQGDVTGPSGAVVDDEIASYSGTTGKIIKGSAGKTATSLVTAANPFSATNRVPLAAGNSRALIETVYTIPQTAGTAGQALVTDGSVAATWQTVGDVTGPAGAPTTGNLASFGASGKVIQDSGISSANVVTNSTTSTADAIARYTGTGKVVTDSVVKIDNAGNMTGVKQFDSTGPFTVTGNLTVTGGGSFSGPLTAQSYTNTSDRNLKKDIAPFVGASDIVDKLVPVNFRWKKGDDRLVIGLIAQEVEKVLPNVVTVSKGKDGAIRSYDVSQVLILTLQALKETRAEVKILQEKIKKLEQKNP